MPQQKSKEPTPENKKRLPGILFWVTLVLVGVVFAFAWTRGGNTLFHYLFRPGGTLGRALPPVAEIEAFYKDRAGALPVARDFDTPEGALCGNGESYFWTSRPPKKPIPLGWKAPPLPGTDPSYQGPDPLAEFKESPYAMPSSKRILGRKPIRDEGDRWIEKELRAALNRTEGKVAVVGTPPDDFFVGDLAARREPLAADELQGDDDEPLARSLIAQGIDFVLYDRLQPAVEPWIEEQMSSVQLRLRDAVSLGWFHPVVLGSRYALFRVTEPFAISTPLKRRMTARVRQMLTAQPVDDLEVEPNLAAVGDEQFRVVVGLRSRAEARFKGRKVIKRIGQGSSLVAALDNAVARIKGDWPVFRDRIVKKYGVRLGTDIPKAVARMEIELDVLYDICTLTDRDAKNLLWYVELGLEGVGLHNQEKFAYLEPSYAVHMEQKKEVRYLEQMLAKAEFSQFLRKPKKKKNKKFGRVLYESAFEKDTEHRFFRFRTVNWIERPDGGDIVSLYRGLPLKTIWDVSRASLVRSLELGARWLMENQSEDGQYAYKYTPTNVPGRRWTAGGNIVRHALNPYTLLMVNKIAPREDYVESAKQGIEFTLQFLREEGNRCVICHRDPPARYYNAKIGAVAVTILSILKLGDVADISQYDEVLRCLGEELLFLQDPNGHYWQYDVPESHPYYGAESTIAPGEFVFALARLYNHYKDERYKESIDRALPFYMKAWRARRDNRTAEGIYDEEHRVNLIGIVPWLVTALNDLHRNTGDPKYAELAFEQQDWIDHEFFWYLNRAQYPDYAGAAFKVHRELPAINSCQYIEGAAAAYDLAQRVKRDEEKRRQVVVHGMRFCLQLQFDDYGSTFFLPVPEEAMGGYRYTLGHLRLRNDYSYHAMAAIAQAVEYLRADDYPSERPLRIPGTLGELLGGRPGPREDAPRSAEPVAPAPTNPQ